jgi:hypothetical protein
MLSSIIGYQSFQLNIGKRSKSRCFGFLFVQGLENFQAALKLGPFVFDNAKVELIEAVPMNLSKKSDPSKRKVCVYGIANPNKDEVASFFEAFGTISQISIKRQKFIYITFECENSAAKAIHSNISFNNQKVSI